MHIELKKDMTIVFQGDSITDCGRREPAHAPYGRGYVSIVATWLIARYPELNLNIINRGISGNRTKDLLNRWDNDCLQIKPDILSVLIGINDVAFRYTASDPTPLNAFEATYDTMLKQARNACNPKLVICEPFLLAHPEGIDVWREDLDPKIQAVRELARRYNAIYVPLDGAFAAASTRAAPSFWAEDGVHPMPQAHALIAQTWMQAVLGKIP
jgi:lysophospholipase L1-like esterase